MSFILKYKLTFLGIALGALAGYVYYHFIGCEGGTCAITSKPLNSTLYGALMGGLVLNLFQKEKPKSNQMNFKTIIKGNQGTIIDVRTPVEFTGGHVPGSINIPLQELPHRLPEIKALKQPLVLCCASGTRSGVATQILLKHGIECLNGGSWLEVQNEQSQKATG